MSLRQILNVTQAWTAALKGVSFVEEQLAKVLTAPTPAERENGVITTGRAHVEALENQAGIQALSQLASLPYVGGSR